MRLPLGFGKKGYFRLASIQASTIEYKTKRVHARLIHTTRLFTDTCDEEIIEDDPPPLTAVAFLGFVSSYRPRICKCSRLFAKRAHSAIKRAKKDVNLIVTAAISAFAVQASTLLFFLFCNPFNHTLCHAF